MGSPSVLALANVYAIMKKDGEVSAKRNSNQCFPGGIRAMFLCFSEKGSTLNYFYITLIRAKKILNLCLKKKPITNCLF